MTRLFSSAAMAAIAAAALGAAPALAQQGYHHAMSSGCMPGKLSVTGEGEARVAPDMATISLGVTTQADTADAAMEENSEKQNAVVEALAQSGVADSDIQTSGLMLTPMINYGNQEAGPNITGYQAQNMVTVRVHDLAELGSVLDAIVQAGANELHGINFTREDSNGAEDQARMSAVEDAMNRAEVMARAAGRELGPILTMGEPPMPPVGPEPMMMRLEAASADSAGVPVSAGEISLMSRVAMEFVLLPAEGEACAMPMRGGPDAGPGDARGPGERPRSRPARDGA
ncbi:MAG: SIMPL domain-containing protein, partial [Paracoccus sp. (in: a-proteobacteria)]|nr:SIMPL domain-containing protein [Paracoccus sp. (in: a-proteobacteria)]